MLKNKIICLKIILLFTLMTSSLLLFAKPEDLLDKPAPDFTLEDLDGDSVILSSFRGYVVLLDFFATWCGPCRAAIPHIKEIHDQFKGQKFVSISIDYRESKSKVKSFAEQYHMDWIVVIDPDGKVFEQYQVTGIPTFFILDKNGVIRFVQVGFTKGVADKIRQKVQELLAQIPPQTFDFNLQALPQTISVTAGQQVTITVKATLVSGTAKQITLSLTGLPSGTNYNFNPQKITPTSTSTLTIDTTNLDGTYTLTITGTGGGISKQTIVTLNVLSSLQAKIGFYPDNISIEKGYNFKINITIFSGASNIYAGEFNISYGSQDLNLTKVKSGNEWVIQKINNKYVFYRNPGVQVGDKSTLAVLTFKHLSSSKRNNIYVNLTLFVAADSNGNDISINLYPNKVKVSIQTSSPPGPSPGGYTPPYRKKTSSSKIYFIIIIIALIIAITTFMIVYLKPSIIYGVKAYLVDSSGRIRISIKDKKTVIGRENFVNMVSRDKLVYITRISKGGHFIIERYGKQYYIIDKYSLNGTLVNNIDIRGKGYVKLNHGDRITIPGVLELIFIYKK